MDILGPVEQPGETPKISSEDMNNLLDAYVAKQEKQQKDKPKIEVKNKKKVAMKVDKFTPNGDVGINFNQPINVPFDFVENKEGDNGRLLAEGGISVSQINANDMFSIFVLQKSEEDSQDLGYSIKLTEWTTKKMGVKVDFQNPLAVSRGIEPDQFMLSIKNPKLFVSKETGESILPENL